MTSVVTQKVDQFFRTYPQRSYPKGQILVFAGEEPEHVFYITKGRVRQYDVSYRGEEVIVNVFKPPSFFPMAWAINKTPNRYFFKTEIDTELHIVPASAAVKFVKDNPDVMYDLLSRLYQGTDGLLGRLVQLMSGSAQTRLLYELVIESHRFGPKGKSGVYQLPLKESDLAARTGLSRETVSRELHKAKDLNLVEVNGQGIVVSDLPAIEQKLKL